MRPFKKVPVVANPVSGVVWKDCPAPLGVCLTKWKTIGTGFCVDRNDKHFPNVNMKITTLKVDGTQEAMLQIAQICQAACMARQPRCRAISFSKNGMCYLWGSQIRKETDVFGGFVNYNDPTTDKSLGYSQDQPDIKTTDGGPVHMHTGIKIKASWPAVSRQTFQCARLETDPNTSAQSHAKRESG